jgi:hypothetical protein
VMAGDAYWRPVCNLASRLRCWSRIAIRDQDHTCITRWGMLLSLPVPDYLEASGGAVPIRCVEWVELSTLRLKGGLAGRPLQRIDATDEVLSSLRELSAIWELRRTTWSIEGLFAEEPIQAVHLPNPSDPRAQKRRE